MEDLTLLDVKEILNKNTALLISNQQDIILITETLLDVIKAVKNDSLFTRQLLLRHLAEAHQSRNPHNIKQCLNDVEDIDAKMEYVLSLVKELKTKKSKKYNDYSEVLDESI